jgi:predicted nucleic acid-binding OB-fold protein
MEKGESRGKLYASRDCLIHSINITSGNVLVSVNQFVKKGDLIVDDIIEISSGGIKKVDTIGTIYGVTWYVIDVDIEKYSDDEGEVFEYALNMGRDELNSKVTNIINVRSQNLLKYENESSRIRLRIHYEVLEDISKGD